MNIIFIVFISFFLYLAIKKPTAFVIVYLLSLTKFLGFFDLGLFVINGVDVGYFSLNIICLFTALVFSKWYKISTFVFPMYLIIILLLILGYLNPYFNGYNSIILAIITSKDFLYFALLFYLFSFNENISVKTLTSVIVYIGSYLSLVLILGAITGIAPPFYLESSGYVRVSYPTFISLSAFIVLADFLNHAKSKLLSLILIAKMLLALFITGYAALTITSITFLVGIYMMHSNSNKIYSIIKNGLILSITIIIIYSFSKEVRDRVDLFITPIVDGSDSSIAARNVYNEFRWNAISERPFLGYGFVHKSSITVDSFIKSDNRFMSTFGIIDSGYVDMIIKFGYFGTISYLLVFFIYVLRCIKSDQESKVIISMGGFLIQYFIINYTWSVFTYPHGIIPLILAIFYIYNSKKNQNGNKFQ